MVRSPLSLLRHPRAAPPRRAIPSRRSCGQSVCAVKPEFWDKDVVCPQKSGPPLCMAFEPMEDLGNGQKET
jgi:hypothetical protein